MTTGPQGRQEPGRISHPAGEARWGGASLALGAILYTFALLAYLMIYGQPEGTGAAGEVTVGDSVRHLLANWRLVNGIWFAEMVAALLLGLAGFVLCAGQQVGHAWLPARAAWIVVGMGGMTLTVMYAFTLGAYPPALAAYDSQPATFAAFRGAATALFYTGSAVLFLGLAGAFLAQTSGPGRQVPRWVAFGGAVAGLIATIQAAALLAGLKQLAIAAPSAIVTFLLASLLGLAIWRGGRPAPFAT